MTSHFGSWILIVGGLALVGVAAMQLIRIRMKYEKLPHRLAAGTDWILLQRSRLLGRIGFIVFIAGSVWHNWYQPEGLVVVSFPAVLTALTFRLNVRSAHQSIESSDRQARLAAVIAEVERSRGWVQDNNLS